jgi:hypothetical protein
MTEISRLTRAGIRRLVALHPETRRLVLRPSLVSPEIIGSLPLSEIEQRFADHLLDRCAGPLVARGAADQVWFEQSLLLRPIAPGSALPVSDEIAAIVAAPQLVDRGALSPRALADRFASRADDALAAAIALLEPDAAAAAIAELAAQPGRDEPLLHLAVLQAGGALAWRPDLLGAEPARGLVDRLIDTLLGLLDRTSPEPLLDAVAPVLGAIAGSPGAVARRARDRVAARLGELRHHIAGRRSGGSFLDEFRALDRPRALPDEDYYMTLPDRRVAEACARILGRSAAPLDRDGFVALQTEVLAGEFGATLLPSFVDGLIAAAAIAPLTELVARLLTAADAEPRLLALRIAAQLPLDGCAEACLACLEDGRAQVRWYAVRAATLLEPERAVPAVIARLDDPEPQVCACAGRALVELGQRDQVELRRMPGELAIGKTRERTAAARAALGDASIDVVSALLPLAELEIEREPARDDSPLVAALTGVLRGSADGLRLAAAIAQEVPAALPILALALAGDGELPAVALPGELRAELARALDPMIEAGGETGMLALEALSRFSLGDAAMIDRIVDAGERTEGYAQQVLAALANVARRSERAALVLAPWLDSHEHIAATVMAAAVAGVALPVDDPRWLGIRELFGLGSIAAAAAHAALVDRARIRCED